MEMGETKKLGNHILIREDALKFNFLDYFKGKKFHMVFTDPRLKQT